MSVHKRVVGSTVGRNSDSVLRRNTAIVWCNTLRYCTLRVLAYFDVDRPCEREGRLFSLLLNRLPGQVSSVDVRGSDPYILGLPFSVEGRFEGLQQDSTFGKQQYVRIGAVVRIALVEEAPGAFDLVLGYLPPMGGEGGGTRLKKPGFS